MRIKILTAFFILLSLCLPAMAQKGKRSKKSGSGEAVYTPKKYNVLFIAVDDLKPDLGCFGFKETHTPNIDQLAARSTVFSNAHCQQAVCGPTRASLLTGLRPDKTQVWDLRTKIRDKNPDIVTLPQYFRQNGYQTIGMGKIFDPRSVDKLSDELSWTVPYKKKFPLAAGYEDLAFETYQSAAIKEKEKAGVKMGGGEDAKSEAKVATECLDVPDDAYMDGAMANYALKQLDNLKNSKEPFFLAVGFKKPHLPFVAPKKYWDLYDRTKINLAAYQQKSVNGPDVAYHNSGELRSFNDIVPVDEGGIGKGNLLKIAEDKQRELIHGYYACISYIDAQIGKLMASLKSTGLDQNTIVVIWGDHGWHLGDHSLWCKHSNFEQAVRVPLLIAVPGLTKGKDYRNPAEFVDIYPTLCDLTGLPVASYLDGKSLLPALKNNTAVIKDFAISQYPRGAGKGARETMGYSIRNNQYRLTEWVGNHFTTAKVFNPADVKAVELYDLVNDPEETKNIAADPARKNVVDQLAEQLHTFYNQQFNTAGVVK